MAKVFVINSRGEKEPFSFNKVYKSARRAGASKELAFKIAKEIEKIVYPGIKTSKIYRKVLQFLAKEDVESRIRFGLKEAIRRLGPSGFPFEKFIGEIFRAQGYRVEFGLNLKGKCGVKYEIDFIAYKDNLFYLGECKFHLNPGERVDLKVGLMNYARFLDLKEGEYCKRFEGYNILPLIVTNAKFTNQVIRYSNCVGQELLGWKYPRGRGLEKIIEEHKLYPVTILPSFRKSFIEIFSSKKIMLVKDLLRYSQEELSQITNLPLNYLTALLNEAQNLISS